MRTSRTRSGVSSTTLATRELLIRSIRRWDSERLQSIYCFGHDKEQGEWVRLRLVQHPNLEYWDSLVLGCEVLKTPVWLELPACVPGIIVTWCTFASAFSKCKKFIGFATGLW